MSGSRGSARRGKIKLRVWVYTNLKKRGYWTHIFLPKIHDRDMIHEKLVKKYGSVAWYDPAPSRAKYKIVKL
ncbi:hypothetical protein PP935_gp141 [Rhizobium phage RHph_N34]|uniref:Uncharacterized protein n=1 Tax=Rhizobium phage RHph_N34 TaxID=2509586 RepID=A0A7S5RA39_9CAUD|nr:hypothetical protein PP935_gp141 [Rhizobium phage RHph_N34]QIG73916.1 hypothetical protein EVC06_141 [Rhizobium phage RHph_N34]